CDVVDDLHDAIARENLSEGAQAGREYVHDDDLRRGPEGPELYDACLRPVGEEAVGLEVERDAPFAHQSAGDVTELVSLCDDARGALSAHLACAVFHAPWISRVASASVRSWRTSAARRAFAASPFAGTSMPAVCERMTFATLLVWSTTT